MATFDITITYPDGQGARILDALKTHFEVETNAEAITAFRVSVRSGLKQIVKGIETEDAVETAKAGVSEVDVT